MEPLKEVGGVRTAFIRELAHKEKGDLRRQVVKPPSSQSFYIDLFSFVSCSGINVKVMTGGGMLALVPSVPKECTFSPEGVVLRPRSSICSDSKTPLLRTRKPTASGE